MFQKTYEVTLKNDKGATITLVMNATIPKVIHDFVGDLMPSGSWTVLKTVEVKAA